MKRYILRGVSDNAAPQDGGFLSAVSCYPCDNKPRIINSAKVMSVVGALLLILGSLLLLLFVAWVGK